MDNETQESRKQNPRAQLGIKPLSKEVLVKIYQMLEPKGHMGIDLQVETVDSKKPVEHKGVGVIDWSYPDTYRKKRDRKEYIQ